jgi:hypothetical protein
MPLVLIYLSFEDLGISVFLNDVVHIFTISYPRSYFILQHSVLFSSEYYLLLAINTRKFQ